MENSSICRVCLIESPFPMCSLKNPKIRNLLRDCTSVSVQPGDGFSQKMCYNCWDQCRKWLVFKTMANGSDQQLKVQPGVDQHQIEHKDTVILEGSSNGNSDAVTSEQKMETPQDNEIEIPSGEVTTSITEGCPSPADLIKFLLQNNINSNVWQRNQMQAKKSVPHPKKFKCVFCPRGYETQGKLNRHHKTHIGQIAPTGSQKKVHPSGSNLPVITVEPIDFVKNDFQYGGQ